MTNFSIESKELSILTPFSSAAGNLKMDMLLLRQTSVATNVVVKELLLDTDVLDFLNFQSHGYYSVNHYIYQRIIFWPF